MQYNIKTNNIDSIQYIKQLELFKVIFNFVEIFLGLLLNQNWHAPTETEAL